ncbi:MAG: hypothetical protein OZSIB_3816 [Candidatus Ozemobacter sibiricus]|jgi:hypothetical protein|uniref:Uncharacterized protein n=1 Tax=Candidatus Ozemobacter sibiricus TaxID=2268124 RepID=A0A367ZQ39_9BACT|nr:MAG: hypothetical protein OZSIB_3816 [Candidatus Ozemobacter sibiricus]
MRELERRFFTPVDGLLIAVLLVGTGLLWWRDGRAASHGRAGYRVFVAGHPERERFFPAPSPTPITIEGVLGPSVIEWDAAGRVRIASSPCPTRLCILTGWVEAPHGTCCAPNGVGVECLTTDRSLDGVTR